MSEPLKVLALIGARSGSKGVPHKNIRLLCGKPLMAWVIEVAQGSHYVNRVIVSTDSQEYAEIAQRYGAQVPFLRPGTIAGDKALDYEYVKYTVEELKKRENYEPDIVVRLLPTVPLQMSEDINNCVQALIDDPDADSAVVIAEAHQHPQKALKLVDDGKGGSYLVSYFTGMGCDVSPTARQSYAKAYFRANVIVCRTSVIFTTDSLTGDRVRPVIIPQERAIDIDSEADFMILEHLLPRFKKTDVSS